MESSLSLVGNRHRLVARQRLAVARSAAAADNIERRRLHQVEPASVKGEFVWLDGYNVLLTVEAALGQAVILAGQDGTYRDMASVHGNYRKVAETLPAIEAIGAWLGEHQVDGCRWLLDSPVSNSGRLKTILLDLAGKHGWNWDVELVTDPDSVLAQSKAIVVSSDSQILDQAEHWLNLAKEVVDGLNEGKDAWLVDLDVS